MPDISQGAIGGDRKLTGNTISLTILWSLISVSALIADEPGQISDEGMRLFEKEVRPVFVERCQKCHGEKKQEAGLRLDSRVALLKGGDSGVAMVSGQPEASPLIQAIRHSGELKMPPSGKLADRQIAAMTEWVRLGAPWPASPEPPADKLIERQRTHWAFQPITDPAPPTVQNEKWVRTAIDRFVLAKLAAVGLEPSPPADRKTLIRRVTYDLTGLPPTPEQVDAFVRDSSPNAYAALIERLLASPQYGEQWARHWLDVARYADTKGYVYAREERFWVHAPAYRDWVVQAFNRDLPFDQFLLLQIAADQAVPTDRESKAAMGFLTLGRRFLGVTHDIIDDRIDVVMRGTMGLTVGCARCHDHKYDPIPTADYYSLYGVFLNSTERLEPTTESVSEDPALLEFQKELELRQKNLADTMLLKRNEAAERVRQRITDYLVAQTELDKYPEEGFDQVLVVTDLIPTFVRRWEAWLALADRRNDPVFRLWRAFAQLKADEFVQRSKEIASELTESGSGVNSRVLSILTPLPISMREVAERYGQLLLDVDREWKAACELAKPVGQHAPSGLSSPDSEAIRQCLYSADSPCLIPDESIVSTENYFDTATIDALWKLQNEVDRWLIQSPQSPAYCVSLVDRELIRPSRIFKRGNPANKGAEVARHFVSVLTGPHPPSFTQGSGRLELARAIIDPANPLTARIWLNRVWQYHFGMGLVKTASDFGIRAESPSHPELLDWLASRFVTEGWSTKSLHRLILLSSTYQQRSDGGDDSVDQIHNKSRGSANQADPENRFLSRMNVRRLSFEEFRDSLLAVSGQLDLRMGGRATDLFAENGTLHRRRTLYGIIDRQFLPSTLRVFDFANPDLHIPSRSETTVPQQALFALNHPFVAKQAQALVNKISAAVAVTPEENVRQLFNSVYQRDPTERQLDTALKFLATVEESPPPTPRLESHAWQYGYGALDETAKQLTSFHVLPYFTGNAWQGGPEMPDATLGWVELTAQGGHPGNDLGHCCVRRWIAPHGSEFSVTSKVIHEVAAGNGIRCWIFSSRGGLLASVFLHNQQQEMNVASVTLEKGDTLDFVVDINGDLNCDQHLWAPVIRETRGVVRPEAELTGLWNAEADFAGPPAITLNRWEQLAQVLLIANELMFVD